MLIMPDVLRTLHGSVKDTVIEVEPTPYEWGKGYFRFKDDWGAFDWGHGEAAQPMPNKIKYKGFAQCLIAAYFAEKVKKMGLPTTYLGLIDPETGETYRPVGDEKIKLTTLMRINIAKVIKPEDMLDEKKNIPSYEEYQKKRRGIVIPVEFIFRFFLPIGSSAFRRMGECRAEPEFFGLNSAPSDKERINLPRPVLDYSTKFDPRGDVYDGGREYYKHIAGLRETEMRNIEYLTLVVGYMMSEEYRKLGMELGNGKLEFILDPKTEKSERTGDRTISLGDVAGTPDEVRVETKDGKQMSKEFARRIYRATQPEWVNACSVEEKIGGRWQERVLARGIGYKPEPLTPAELDLFSGIHTSLANAFWELEGKPNAIPGAPTLAYVDKEYKKFMLFNCL